MSARRAVNLCRYREKEELPYINAFWHVEDNESCRMTKIKMLQIKNASERTL